MTEAEAAIIAEKAYRTLNESFFCSSLPPASIAISKSSKASQYLLSIETDFETDGGVKHHLKITSDKLLLHYGDVRSTKAEITDILIHFMLQINMRLEGSADNDFIEDVSE